MNASSAADLPIRTAPLALWRIAGAFMHLLYTLFGAPETIARRRTLTPKSYRRLASWLSAGEAMLRRLLLMEAAAYWRPRARPALRKTRARTRPQRAVDPERPHTWRVSFRCLAERREHRSRRQSGVSLSLSKATRTAPSGRFATTAPANGGGKPLRSALPLAVRYEALIRVFNHPAPFAKRLAARLYATPRRVAQLPAAPPLPEHRIENCGELRQAADRRRARVDTS